VAQKSHAQTYLNVTALENNMQVAFILKKENTNMHFKQNNYKTNYVAK